MDTLFDPQPFGKRCTACGEIKPGSEFHKHRGNGSGLQSRCKPCNIASAKKYYSENQEYCRDLMAQRDRPKKERNVRLLFDYLLLHPCVDCGESDPVVLEFDHLRDEVKNVSAMAHMPLRWEVILAEIAKCEVVCANCHRRRTSVRANSYRVRMMRALDSPGMVVGPFLALDLA